jgi:uncharacterized protein YbbC (DUF1343 family)/CubicO group peptidase (beta-lactamase class C family)
MRYRPSRIIRQLPAGSRLFGAPLFGLVLAGLMLGNPCRAQGGGLPHAEPADVGLDPDHLRRIDGLIEQGLAEKKMPGCVLCIGRRGKIVWLKAYGQRQVEPSAHPMTVDTVFDLASITKPVATATSIMLLVERGQLRLGDKVASLIREFAVEGKGAITVQDLLLHTSGLLPDNALSDYDRGPEEALHRICALKLQAPTGTRFIYSDVNYILLGELVRRVSGQSLSDFTQAHLFQPLEMRESGYLPEGSLRDRAAPTEQRDGKWMQGEVHDPRAFKLGGVAGHAGLFSTASDLAIYAQMMLDGGRLGEKQILSPPTVDLMTRGYRVPGGLRGLGWDKRTGYSLNRGELLSDSAFGHGGFTGTVLWIDPELQLFYIFLSNRVHPDGKGLVNPLAGRIGSVVAASVRDRGARSEPRAPALAGIDVLQRDGFRQLEGRCVGLITNHTGRNQAGVSTVRLLQGASNVRVVALFGPEHGFEGKLDVAKVPDGQDPATGLKVYSLYGETRRPTLAMLEGIDTLVFDIQDIGARFYTYLSTMGEAMTAAAEHGRRFVVLDRPNPINGRDVAGPVSDVGRESFTAFHRLPVRHGLTLGELARLLREERQLNLDLEVIACEGWRRNDFWDATGLSWVNPSPNMRNLTQALLYPGIGLLETTNLSVGRGTDAPFERIGAPWLDGRRLAAELNARHLPGVTFVPIEFEPASSKFANQKCGGMNVLITDRRTFEPVRTGLAIAVDLRRLFPEQWDTKALDRLLVHQRTHQAIVDGRPLDEVEAAARDGVDGFLRRRAAFLLYE